MSDNRKPNVSPHDAVVARNELDEAVRVLPSMKYAKALVGIAATIGAGKLFLSGVNPPLFLARDGASYTSSGFRASWRLVVARAKLSNIRFHDLRRKAGSDADDLDHAQELLGHADAKVTRKHYRAKPVAVQPIGIKKDR
jgi:integrase